MKYALLIYEKPGALDGVGEEERSDMYGEYMALSEDSRCLGGAQLQPVPTATTVRVQNGNTLTTDGPFADTKEVFGGYYVFEAGNLDEALELAARFPPPGTAARSRSGRWSVRALRSPRLVGVGRHRALIEQVFRDEWGRVLAHLVGFLGDFELAEDAAQDAFAIAAERWPREGVPANPGRLARGDRPQPGDRPHPPRPHACREDPACSTCQRPPRTR